MTNIPQEAPSVLQAWMLAIPSVMTALSTWYISRKTAKTVTKSDEKTKGVVEDASASVNEELKLVKAEVEALKEENKKLTAKVDETRNCQLTISQKHTETMNEVHTVLKSLAPREDAASSASVDTGKVKTIEEPKQPLGKVILKP